MSANDKELGNSELKRRRRRLLIGFMTGIGMTYALAAYGFIWFISAEKSLAKVMKVPTQKGNSEVKEIISYDEYVAQTEANEKYLLNEWNQRRNQAIPDQDPKNVYSRWHARVDQLNAELENYEEFPEGSIQWGLKQELERLNADKPKR